MKTFRSLSPLLILLAARAAWAQDCHYKIEANDQMQYNARQMQVPADCTDIEVTLVHTGIQMAKVMGHDWVLVKTSDMVAIANAGLAAGFAHNWLPQGDKRIIASIRVVGGGESASVHIPASALTPGADYTFFCSAPGHYVVMRGRFIFGAKQSIRAAGNISAGTTLTN
jgi:azurin